MEKELKQQFEEVCKAYLDAFVKRHDLVSADWVGPGACEIVCANGKTQTTTICRTMVYHERTEK